MPVEAVNQETADADEHEELKQQGFLGMSKKQRRRELKAIGFELRELPEEATDEDKLICLFRKFQMVQIEMDENVTKAKQSEKRALNIALERDQFLEGFNKVTSHKDKLEQLCRELQKQNHLIRDQSIAMAQSEDEKRKEVADRFQSGINEIQDQLKDYLDKNNALRAENQMLAEKLQKFILEHEKREEHVEKVIKTRDLETKLAEAKLTQARVQHEQAIVKEKQETAAARERCDLMEQRLQAHKVVEDKLKEQIEFYKTKYQSFNKTMSKSNELIENTKKEIEKMTKHVRTAESAALEWRSKWEQSQKSLLGALEQLAAEKDRGRSLQNQVEKLGSLCRALRGGGKAAPLLSDQPSSSSKEVTADGSTEDPEVPPSKEVMPAEEVDDKKANEEKQ